MKHRMPLLLMLSALILTALPGCAQTSFMKAPAQILPNALQKKSQQPTRILCLWETAEGQGLDGRSSRGFAGQILFFGYQEAQPVLVDGTVRIYQYDNYDPDELDPKPIHVFVFDSTGWNAHRAESTVGESYNVFLPYVKPQQGTAHCALKVEFIPKQGRSIVSPVTEITLEGRRRRSGARSVVDREASRKTRPVSRSQVHEVTRPPQEDDSKLDTLTIRLPKSNQL